MRGQAATGNPYPVTARASSPYAFPERTPASSPYAAPGSTGQPHPASPDSPGHGVPDPGQPAGAAPSPGLRRRNRSTGLPAADAGAEAGVEAMILPDAPAVAAHGLLGRPDVAPRGLLDAPGAPGRTGLPDGRAPFPGTGPLVEEGRLADRRAAVARGPLTDPGPFARYGPGDPRPGEADADDEHAARVPRPPARGPLLPVVSIVLAAWSLTCLIDLGRPRTLVGILAAVAALSPLAAAVAVLLTALALRERRWVTAGVAIVAGLVPWLFALPYAVPAPTPSGPLTPVRVLVVNAREGRADPKNVAAAVRTNSVDLLVVTELTSRMAHDLTTSGIDGRLVARWVSVPPIATTGTAAQAGLGIWSRFTMSDFTPVQGTRWPAVRATLETGHGKLTVVAGHVVPPTLFSSGSWSTDLAALHAAGDVPGPVTVLGGLNGTPWNPQFREAASGGLRDAGDVLGRGIRPTWPSWLGIPLLPLDHALVGGRVGVQSLVGATIDGTDHRALLVTLLVPDDRT